MFLKINYDQNKVYIFAGDVNIDLLKINMDSTNDY